MVFFVFLCRKGDTTDGHSTNGSDFGQLKISMYPTLELKLGETTQVYLSEQTKSSEIKMKVSVPFHEQDQAIENSKTFSI